jgi:hypothetical protein
MPVEEVKATSTKPKIGRRASDPAASTRMTIEDVQQIGTFFKDMIESTHLKWWIILAGVGGLCEAARLLWDVARFLLTLKAR